MATYKRQRYLLMATDPVHIGTGGYRLGRVDNSIVREPGTRVPKIPGTSLHGAVRSYAAKLYETPEAAGQNQDKVNNPDENPICYTFGYLKKEKSGDEEKTSAYSGVVNIFDAQVLLFPVHSMAGPVWVSTVGRLRGAGFSIGDVPGNWDTGAALLTWDRQDALNLGWLMVNVAGQVAVTAPDKWNDEERWKAVANHIVLVQEALFSQVVNSNLEVRTSVAIDPERGAAEDKALFTYEALPRATFLTAEVVLDDYRDVWPLSQETWNQTAKGNVLPGSQTWSGPLEVVKAGLRMVEWLGVGGMGTRGFGRMAIVGEPLEQAYGEEVWQ
ncbi:MAG: type III-B CRISPR module RAMP protein Cmr4 [Candidatus Bipolaricaulaceae bacterium]